MGQNRLRSVASEWRDKLANSPRIIGIFLAAMIMLVIAGGIFIEDYTTSLEGYKLYPTRKYHDWVVYLVALLPQVGQIVFAYAFLTDTDRWLSLVIAIALHVADVYTDVTYKMVGGNWLGTWLESELVYTLGSEIALGTALGIVLTIYPDVVQQVKRLRFGGRRREMSRNQGRMRPISRAESRRPMPTNGGRS